MEHPSHPQMHNPHHHQSEPFVIRRLNTQGRVMARPIPSTQRTSYAFFYLSEGEVLTEAGGESLLLRKNTMLIIPPHVPYAVKWYDNVDAMMGGFEESFLLDPSYQLLHTQKPELININPDDVALMSAMMQKLSVQQPKPHIVQYTLDFILRLMNETMDNSKHESDSLAVRFIDEVFNRSGVTEGVNRYAEQLGVSPNHLNKVVKAHTGRTASEWVQISRLNYAKYLLRDTNIPIIDVAARVGLFDQSYFSRFFKKHTGMSPLEYRGKAHQ